MPWKETHKMDEKLKFIAERLKKEISMTDLCCKYGVSRKTGYKWFDRYLSEGLRGLEDRPRTPHHYRNEIPQKTIDMILDIRRNHPTWGPVKLLHKLKQKYSRQKKWPVASSVGNVIKRHGLVVGRKKRRRTPVYNKALTNAQGANHVWCADFKGWFETKDRQRCTPLTITDNYSRFIIRCHHVPNMSLETVKSVFESAFREYGLPQIIRTDNGTPFASRGLGGLSKLSVWWIKLGIIVERIEPGKPGQNGRHERMHRTLKKETANPPASNTRLQQRRFDTFQKEFNFERPHQALDLKTPAELFEPSQKGYPRYLENIKYNTSMIVRKVHPRGEINFNAKRFNIGEAFWGEKIGLEQIEENLYRIWFSNIELGMLDVKKRKVVPKKVRKKKYNCYGKEKKHKLPLFVR